jgi:uncharacterized protein YkwD
MTFPETRFDGVLRFQARIRDLVTIAVLALTAIVLPVLSAKASSNDADSSRSLANSARVSKGLSTLKDTSGLNIVAQRHAERMADADMIFHNENRKSEADAEGVNWTLIGENVGVGKDAASVHDGFMASPGHRDNILYADYNSIGVGAAVGKDGSIFITQLFARVEGAAKPQAPKPAPVAEPKPQVVEQPVVQQPQETASVLSETEVKESPSHDPNAVIGGIVND